MKNLVVQGFFKFNSITSNVHIYPVDLLSVIVYQYVVVSLALNIL